MMNRIKVCFGIAVSLFPTLVSMTHAEEKTPLCDLYLIGRRQFLDQGFELKSQKAKVAFFDADGTLRVSSKSDIYPPNTPEEVVILPNVAERIKQLNAEGYLIAIVSNQGGVPKFNTYKNMDLALHKTITLIREQGGVIHYYDFAERDDVNRKPMPGMANNLRTVLKMEFGEDADIDWSKTIMVGDAAYKKGELRPDGSEGTDFSNSDRLFANNLGIPFHEAKVFFAGDKMPQLFPAKVNAPRTAARAKSGTAVATNKKGGRKFAMITMEELKAKIDAALEEEGGYASLTPQIEKDLAKVEFDSENEDVEGSFGGMKDLTGYKSLDNGMNYLGVAAGGDWEHPVYFIIYWDGSKLRGYIPTGGNPWNTKTKQAYGNDEEEDLKNANQRFVKDLGLNPKDHEITDLGSLTHDAAAIEADIRSRILAH